MRIHRRKSLREPPAGRADHTTDIPARRLRRRARHRRDRGNLRQAPESATGGNRTARAQAAHGETVAAETVAAETVAAETVAAEAMAAEAAPGQTMAAEAMAAEAMAAEAAPGQTMAAETMAAEAMAAEAAPGETVAAETMAAAMQLAIALLTRGPGLTRAGSVGGRRAHSGRRGRPWGFHGRPARDLRAAAERAASGDGRAVGRHLAKAGDPGGAPPGDTVRRLRPSRLAGPVNAATAAGI
jgi:hypothetical protein